MILKSIMLGALVGPVLLCGSFAQGFTDVTMSSGTVVAHDGNQIIDMQIGSGAAWIDYDQDGDLDLYVTLRTGANKMFKNNGSGGFVNVAANLGLTDATGDGGGVSVADFNNDGWPDLFLANCQGCKLYKNNSGTSFTDITNTAFTGVPVGGPSRTPSASWGDYNNDGFLDLYLAQHTPSPVFDPPLGAITQDFLFYNTGNETFVDVSALLGMNNLTSWGFIGAWTDYDHDDDLDIILVNDCRPAVMTPLSLPTRIFRNDGGTDPLSWGFTEVSVSVGINDCRNGMGVAIGDYNRDGWMDVFYTNIGPCVLFKNDHGVFQNVTISANLNVPQSPLYSWGCAFIDYDLDGWQDLSVMLGALGGTAQQSNSPNFFFKNNGDGTFTDIAATLGLAFPQKSRNGIVGDYDNDGDLDLYVVNYGDTCRLMRNDINNGWRWLQIDLDGISCNRDGVGSKIQIVTPDGVTQYYETRSGSNLGGGDSPYAHFGLRTQNVVSTLRVKWPSGRIQTLSNVAVNQRLLITEDTSIHVTKIWNGTVDSVWSNIDNWVFATKPRADDVVYIPAGVSHNPELGQGSLVIGNASLPSDFSCGEIIIAPGATLTASAGTTIENHGLITIGGLFHVQHPAGILNKPGGRVQIEANGIMQISE